MRLVPSVPAPAWLARPALLIASLVVLAGPAHAQQPRTFDPALTYRVPVNDAPARGPADALITIVELSDFTCAFCGRAQTTLAELERLYPGQLRLVYRHNPLDLDDASLAAEASMAAAAQGRFWPMHDRLYAAGGRVERTQVEDFALALGLDLGQFRGDLDTHRHRPRIAADAALAHGLGAYSTPTFFINGRPLLGAQPLDVFVQVVEEELARARTLLARGTPRHRIYDAVQTSALLHGAPLDASQPESEEARNAELDASRIYRVGPGLPGHTVGPEQALLTVVVFSDFQCPYCMRLQPALQALRREYGDEVRIVFRHLPLSSHPRAQLAAEAAVAAAMQGKLWEFHDRLFATPGRLARADLERHARAIGLDMTAFRAALDDRRYLELVASDAANAGALGVRGTPTMFVNGTPVVGSAPFEYLQRMTFEPRMAEARALVARGVAPADVYETILQTAQAGAPTTRVAPMQGAVEMDRDQRRAALLRACRTRDGSGARIVYRAMQDAGERSEARLQCRPYGVELSDTDITSPAGRQ
jgi:protein-disulfide isomerase